MRHYNDYNISHVEVRQGQKITISLSCALILLYGSTGLAAVPQLSCYEGALIVFFDTNWSPVLFMNDLVGYHLDGPLHVTLNSKLKTSCINKMIKLSCPLY